MEYGHVERVLGKALEKLLSEQKFLGVMQALRTHLFVTKEGVTEGFLQPVFGISCLWSPLL